MEQKIKQDIQIGINIRKIRKKRRLGQTDLVRLLQIEGCDMTRECLVKIERCVQHIQASQLQAIKKYWIRLMRFLLMELKKIYVEKQR